MMLKDPSKPGTFADQAVTRLNEATRVLVAIVKFHAALAAATVPVAAGVAFWAVYTR